MALARPGAKRQPTARVSQVAQVQQESHDEGEHLPRVFTVTELAEQFKCTPQFFRAEIRRGRLRAHRLGGRHYRVTAEDFRTWLDEAVR